MLLEQGPFSLDGMALPCVDRAGCWETDLLYLFTVEWVTDPFVLVHAYSDLLGAMLAAMLSCVVWWSALVGHCPFGGLAQWWLVPAFQDVPGFPFAGCDAGRCLCGLITWKVGCDALCSLLQDCSRISR